MADMIDYFMTF